MPRYFVFLVTMSLLASGLPDDRGITGVSNSPHVKIKNLNIGEVRWTGGFWAEKWEINRSVSIPVVWKALNNPENGASFRNFLRVNGKEEGGAARTNWGDGDVYKYLESVAYVYGLTGDERLNTHMDEMIAEFAAAQDSDGYISTPQKLKGFERWSNLHHHELYNMGHLMTAASIHYRVTGKTSFLKVAEKLGDYLYDVFAPRPKELAHFGFNPSNIMGAAELYRSTGNRKYIELAGIFVDMRGSQPGGPDLNQQRIPLRKETEAVGHAVTANYLYAGAADVYGETGEQALLDALERIWTNATTQKVYVTGAVGNLFKGYYRDNHEMHEAYGIGYELPLRLGYNETCANIGNAMWNWRMLSLTGEAKYADMMERVLYNSMLPAVAADGSGFMYNNPLRRHAHELPKIMRRNDPWERTGILQCYCCPPSVTRTIGKLPGWVYGKSDGALWVHLYGSNEAETGFAGGVLKIRQETDYPWDGAVRITLEETPGTSFALMLRIPEWAGGATIAVNGRPIKGSLPGQSYEEIRRRWEPGDTVALNLPMEPRLVVANPYVEDTRGQVAVMRGPIVYALESPDLPPSVRVSDIHLPAKIDLRPRHHNGLLGGVTVLEGRAFSIRTGDWTRALYQTLRAPERKEIDVTLIPYYAWANRGPSHMTVWIPVVF